MYNFSQQTLPDPITQIITFNNNIHRHDTRNRSKPHITQQHILIVNVLKSGTQSQKILARWKLLNPSASM